MATRRGSLGSGGSKVTLGAIRVVAHLHRADRRLTALIAGSVLEPDSGRVVPGYREAKPAESGDVRRAPAAAHAALGRARLPVRCDDGCMLGRAVGPTYVELVRRPPALTARECWLDRIGRRVVYTHRPGDRGRVSGCVGGADRERMLTVWERLPFETPDAADAGEGQGLVSVGLQANSCRASTPAMDAWSSAHPGVVGAHGLDELVAPHPLPLRQRPTHAHARRRVVVQQHLHPATVERGSGRAARRPAHDQLAQLGRSGWGGPAADARSDVQ